MKRAIGLMVLLGTAACTSSGNVASGGSGDGGGPALSDGGAPGVVNGEAGDAGNCPVVQTAGGPLEGAPSGATCTYEGIPYAAPPTGDLRWKAPQPAASWTTPRPSVAASGCPQTASEFGTASTDEDCLYLNVWNPAPKAASPAPVMVFVHGGSFLYGSGAFPLYDGTNLAAATGHVIVTINYRLGPLGFLSNPALRAEDPANPSAGDYGIEDQIAALQWVQKNITAFGGDPANVTLFGESAGGTSMFVHLASPKSAGLFKQVIIESGAGAVGDSAVPQSYADATGASFASALGCTDASALLTCLRGKSVSDIVAQEGSSVSATWWPAVDGFVLPSDPKTLFASGTINKVPTLVGNNKNEGTLFVAEGAPTDPTSYLAFANQIVPGSGSAIVAQYPITNFGNSYQAASAEVFTDGIFVCPTRTVVRAIAATGTPVYRYEFVHMLDQPPPLTNIGVFHGSELVFVFGNRILGEFGAQPDELPLEQLIMGYWGGMAASGTPNGGSRFNWPTFDTSTETDLVLDTTPATETKFKDTQCDFWDTIQ